MVSSRSCDPRSPRRFRVRRHGRESRGGRGSVIPQGRAEEGPSGSSRHGHERSCRRHEPGCRLPDTVVLKTRDDRGLGPGLGARGGEPPRGRCPEGAAADLPHVVPGLRAEPEARGQRARPHHEPDGGRGVRLVPRPHELARRARAAPARTLLRLERRGTPSALHRTHPPGSSEARCGNPASGLGNLARPA